MQLFRQQQIATTNDAFDWKGPGLKLCPRANLVGLATQTPGLSGEEGTRLMATDVMGPEEALRGGERGQSVRRWGPILLYILLCQSECFFITFN